MSEIIEFLSDSVKGTTSHIVVASAITFSHENKFLSVMAVLGAVVLALAWVHHCYKLFVMRKAAKVLSE